MTQTKQELATNLRWLYEQFQETYAGTHYTDTEARLAAVVVQLAYTNTALLLLLEDKLL